MDNRSSMINKLSIYQKQIAVASGRKFRIPTTLFDLISILLGVFMFLALFSVQQAKNEYQIKLNIIQKKINQMTASQPNADTPSLSIINQAGNPVFILTSNKTKTIYLKKSEAVKTTLAERQPAKLILRVDKDIPSGIMQSIIIDCQDLHIIPYLSTRSSG